MTRKTFHKHLRRQDQTISEKFIRIRKIHGAIGLKDIETLRNLSKTEDGFIGDGLRRYAWPVVLGASELNTILSISKIKHRDEDQVKLDVERSFVNFPQNMSISERIQRKQDLFNLIIYVLRQYPSLCYYQGYHDICSVFLLVLGAKKAAQICSIISGSWLRDNMMDTLSPVLWQLKIIPILLEKSDPFLFNMLNSLGSEHYYALSWILTWFSHDLNDLNDIMRLFDLFISSNPIMPIYVSVALIIYHKETIKNLPLEMKQDSAILYSTLSKLPSNSFPVSKIIFLAINLYNEFPPNKLPLKNILSSWSTINTWRADIPGGEQIDNSLLESYRKQAQIDDEKGKLTGSKKISNHLPGHLLNNEVQFGITIGVIGIASAIAYYAYSYSLL